MSEIGPYPWTELERVGRRTVAAGRSMRRALGPVVVADLCSVAASLLTADVSLADRHRSVRRRGDAFSADGAVVDLETGEGLPVALWLEAPLADAVLARLLRRPPIVARPNDGFSDVLRGALAALSVEILRRSGCVSAPRPGHPAPDDAEGAVVRATVLLDGAPYRAGAWVPLLDRSPPRAARVELGHLGRLPLGAALVGAHARIDRAELAALRSGDVVLPGGWLVDFGAEPTHSPPIAGALHLAPGSSGLCWELRPSGPDRLVITGDVTSVDALRATKERPMNEPDESLAEAVLATPVLVQVEIGTVTLPAREWAALGPGDVIETGVRLGEHAVLRVGGVEVARGELVSVDGNVGVRIERLTAAGRELSESD